MIETNMKRLISCVAFVIAISVLASPLPADDWNQWLGANRDGTWNETGIMTSLPKDGLKVVWRKPVSNGFSGPAVAGDRVFVTDYVIKGGDAATVRARHSAALADEKGEAFDALLATGSVTS